MKAETTTDKTLAENIVESKLHHIEAKASGYEDRDIRFTLTESEKLELHNKNYMQQIALRDHKREMSRNRKIENERKKELESDIELTIGMIQQGGEVRQTRCLVVKDHEHFTVEYYDASTGDLVDTRKMTHEERQLSLRFNERGGGYE